MQFRVIVLVSFIAACVGVVDDSSTTKPNGERGQLAFRIGGAAVIGVQIEISVAGEAFREGGVQVGLPNTSVGVDSSERHVTTIVVRSAACDDGSCVVTKIPDLGHVAVVPTKPRVRLDVHASATSDNNTPRDDVYAFDAKPSTTTIAAVPTGSFDGPSYAGTITSFPVATPRLVGSTFRVSFETRADIAPSNVYAAGLLIHGAELRVSEGFRAEKSPTGWLVEAVAPGKSGIDVHATMGDVLLTPRSPAEGIPRLEAIAESDVADQFLMASAQNLRCRSSIPAECIREADTLEAAQRLDRVELEFLSLFVTRGGVVGVGGVRQVTVLGTAPDQSVAGTVRAGTDLRERDEGRLVWSTMPSPETRVVAGLGDRKRQYRVVMP